MPMAMTTMPTRRRIRVSGKRDWRRARVYAPSRPPTPARGRYPSPVPPSRAHEATRLRTAIEVTMVDARVAGATSDGRRPVPIRAGARIDLPPIP